MKKIVLTFAIVLGLGLTTFADPNGGGLFQRGANREQEGTMFRDINPLLPQGHGWDNNANGSNGEQVPLGSGIAVLVGLGASYLIGKRRREE